MADIKMKTLENDPAILQQETEAFSELDTSIREREAELENIEAFTIIDEFKKDVQKKQEMRREYEEYRQDTSKVKQKIDETREEADKSEGIVEETARTIGEAVIDDFGIGSINAIRDLGNFMLGGIDWALDTRLKNSIPEIPEVIPDPSSTVGKAIATIGGFALSYLSARGALSSIPKVKKFIETSKYGHWIVKDMLAGAVADFAQNPDNVLITELFKKDLGMDIDAYLEGEEDDDSLYRRLLQTAEGAVIGSAFDGLFKLAQIAKARRVAGKVLGEEGVEAVFSAGKKAKGAIDADELKRMQEAGVDYKDLMPKEKPVPGEYAFIDRSKDIELAEADMLNHFMRKNSDVLNTYKERIRESIATFSGQIDLIAKEFSDTGQVSEEAIEKVKNLLRQDIPVADPEMTGVTFNQYAEDVIRKDVGEIARESSPFFPVYQATYDMLFSDSSLLFNSSKLKKGVLAMVEGFNPKDFSDDGLRAAGISNELIDRINREVIKSGEMSTKKTKMMLVNNIIDNVKLQFGIDAHTPLNPKLQRKAKQLHIARLFGDEEAAETLKKLYDLDYNRSIDDIVSRVSQGMSQNDLAKVKAVFEKAKRQVKDSKIANRLFVAKGAGVGSFLGGMYGTANDINKDGTVNEMDIIYGALLGGISGIGIEGGVDVLKKTATEMLEKSWQNRRDIIVDSLVNQIRACDEAIDAVGKENALKLIAEKDILENALTKVKRITNKERFLALTRKSGGEWHKRLINLSKPIYKVNKNVAGKTIEELRTAMLKKTRDMLNPDDFERAVIEAVGAADEALKHSKRVSVEEVKNLAQKLMDEEGLDNFISNLQKRTKNIEAYTLGAGMALKTQKRAYLNTFKKYANMSGKELADNPDIMAKIQRECIQFIGLDGTIRGEGSKVARATNMLGQINRALGNRETLKRMSSTTDPYAMRRMMNEVLNADEAAQNAIVENYTNGVLDFLKSYRILSMLSSPKTWARNITSNTLMTLRHIASDITQPKKIFKYMENMKEMMGESLAAATINAKTGYSTAGGTKFGIGKSGGMLFQPVVNPKGLLQKVQARVTDTLNSLSVGISRALSSPDEFFYTLNKRMSIVDQAYRQAEETVKAAGNIPANEKDRLFAKTYESLKRTPTQNMDRVSAEFAQYQVFRSPLEGAGKAIADFLRSDNLIIKTLSATFVPFVDTPINILKEATRFTFGGTAEMAALGAKSVGLDKTHNLIKRMGMNYDDLIQKGIITKRQANTYMTYGSLLLGYGMFGALNGTIRGGLGDYKNTRGEKKFSISIGNLNLGFDGLDPLSMPLAIGSTMVEYALEAKDDVLTSTEFVDDEGNIDMTAMMTNVFGKSILGAVVGSGWAILNSSFLQGAQDLLAAIASEDSYGAERAFKNYVSSYLPAGVKQLETSIDPTVKEVWGLIDELQARIPIMSKSLPNRLDLYGEPEKEVAPFFPAPMTIDLIKDDALYKEIDSVGLDLYSRFKNMRQIGGMQLSPEQYYDLRKEFGNIMKTRKKGILNAIKNMDENRKRDYLSFALRQAKELATQRFLVNEPTLRRKYMKIKQMEEELGL